MTYTPGHDFYAKCAPETATITEGASGAEPDLTAVPPSAGIFVIGQINPADILDDDGEEKGFGAGSKYALYDQLKGRIYESTITQRVADIQFIDRCLPVAVSAGAPYGLPLNALYYGTTTTPAVYRQSVCNQLSGEFSEGSGSELSVTAQMWSKFKDSATTTVPTTSEMRALGTPYTWHHLTEFTIDGTHYLSKLGGFSFTQNHNLERKGFRPVYVGDGIKASRTTYDLLPHHVNGEGELRFHEAIKTTTNDWGDIIATIGDTEWTWVNCRPAQRRQPGIESSGQIGFTVPFKFDYMQVTA
jgi:hypothetical protein